MPAKADPVAQRTFYEGTLLPLINKAKEGKITLMFVDASHFVMGCDYLGYIYGKVRRFVRTYSGRNRYNVLAAMDFITKKMTTVTNDAYITATEICELLRKVSSEHFGKPIFMVLDNARYQKCKVVMELALKLKISLVYIPPYSPNLNLIERLWKHVKGKLRIKCYDDFSEFKIKIDSIIGNTDKADKSTVDKLIGEKVQLFDNAVFDSVIHFPNTSTSSKTSKKAA